MQYDSFFEVFDTVELTPEVPAHPMGELYSYYPSLTPEALHYHNFLELGYCEHGTGVFLVDGEIIPFRGRCATIIYEGQKHIAQSINPQKSLWHFLYVDLDLLFAGSNLFGTALASRIYYQDFEIKNLLTYEEHPDIFELVRIILGETAGNDANALPVLRGLVYALLSKHNRFMVRKSENAQHRYLQNLDDIAPTLDYINMYYMENITTERLLNISNSSKASLQRKFLAVTGYSPIQYLHNLRIKRASIMLLDKKKPIVEISMDVGYNSLSSFNRQFLSMTGMSPSSWRKKNRSTTATDTEPSRTATDI